MKFWGKFFLTCFTISLATTGCTAPLIRPLDPATLDSAIQTALLQDKSSQQNAAEPSSESSPNTDQATANIAPSGDTATNSVESQTKLDLTTLDLPKIEPSKFNVAFIYVSPIGDGGWTYAHNQGRMLIDKHLGDKVHTIYLENVPEGPEAIEVLRAIAQAGYQAIFTTSFGYMEANEIIAAEFPNVQFVHVSGSKKNGKNFANLFGAMEDMKYLVGMIAGARAIEDGSKRIGYIATHPIPEVIRYVNATAMGMRQVCADCVMDLRWTREWFDPAGERRAAEEMMDTGATVIITGADTTEPIKAARERKLWSVGYDSDNACEADQNYCLTTSYWDWGQVYIWLLYKMFDGKFQGEDYYFEVDSNGVGLLGFMTGQKPAQGVPASIVPKVKNLLQKMRRGGSTRFSIFTGPIYNNKGEMVVPQGTTLTQSDLEGLRGIAGRPDCTICMNWLAEGILPELEIPE